MYFFKSYLVLPIFVTKGAGNKKVETTIFLKYHSFSVTFRAMVNVVNPISSP